MARSGWSAQAAQQDSLATSLTLGLAWQASSETSSPGVAAHPQGDAASPHRTSTGGRG